MNAQVQALGALPLCPFCGHDRTHFQVDASADGVDAMTAQDDQPATRAQVDALRCEVAELKAALLPSTSPIVHGAEALSAFAALRREARHG